MAAKKSGAANGERVGGMNVVLSQPTPSFVNATLKDTFPRLNFDPLHFF